MINIEHTTLFIVRKISINKLVCYVEAMMMMLQGKMEPCDQWSF